MSNDTLLPCPFCGGIPKLQTDGENGYWIECQNFKCGASTNIRIALMDDVRPLLMEQWNRRAAQVEPAPTLPLTDDDIAQLEVVDLIKLEAIFAKYYPEHTPRLAYAFKRRYDELERQK